MSYETEGSPNIPSRPDGFDRALASIAIVILVLGLAIFWGTGFRDRISSDAAVTLLLAQHILDTGTLLPADWYYGNGDLWILGPQVVSLPFVALWGVTPLALSCGNALGLAFIFASAFALAYAICERWPAAALTASLSVALYSHFQREFVVMQLSYGWMSAKLMLLVSAAIVWLRWAERSPSHPRAFIVLAAYGVLLGVWTAENPVRPLLYLVVPLAVVLALRASRLRYPTVVLAAATIVAMALGWLVRHWLVGRLSMAPGLETFRIAPTSEWPRHLQMLLAGVSHLYGGDALGVSQLPAAEKALAWIRMISIPGLAILVASSGIERASISTWGWLPLQIACLDIVIVAAVLVAGSTLVDPIGDRYLIPAWQLALVGMVAASAQVLARWRWIAVALVLAFLLGAAINSLGIMRARSSFDSAGLPHPPPLDGIIALLREGGMARGFASHRYANAITVRSSGDIELCDVLFDPQLRPARWLNTKSCADPDTYSDGFFLLLAPDERDSSRATLLRTTIGQPQNVLSVDDVEIWTYPRGAGNLAWLSR